ncbi:oxidoreductase [Adhaeribacter terreus]|uniref:Oxidoreductase n=1 Tax=Adhaeribacter terreus TaxID=529703 RepID=A0ABW0EBP4_9BACT
MVPQKTALIAGASGLVGSYLLRMLLQSSHYDKVISVGRRKLELEHPKLEQRIVDFDKLAVTNNLIADNIFCCLGTTMKQAGSKENFYKVDYTYVVELAKATSKHFARQFLVVSAMGADPDSKFYYNRVKGDMEKAVKELPFTAVHIFRPSLLTGDRQESRLGEKIGEAVLSVLNPIMLGPLKKYRSVPARCVAKAMLLTALESGGGVKVHESDEIARIGK